MRVPTRKAELSPRKRKDASMTAEKYLELKKELEKLLKFVRPKFAEEVKKHASDGDFSENAAYQIAKGKLRGLNRWIDEIDFLLKNADIIEPIGNSGYIQVGNTAVVEVNGKQKIFRILGSTETDPAGGIISKDSPLGRALLGKGPGETARLKINKKTVDYKIIEIK